MRIRDHRARIMRCAQEPTYEFVDRRPLWARDLNRAVHRSTQRDIGHRVGHAHQGMAAAGRYLSLRLRLSDRPGALAALMGELSALDANVLDVSHVRTDPRLGLDEVEVELHLETKGPEHCVEVASGLRAAGYTVKS